MKLTPKLVIPLGAALVAGLGFLGSKGSDAALADALSAEAERSLSDAGLSQVSVRFATSYGAPTRHPVLSGGDTLDDEQRTRAAQLVKAVAGVGGVNWSDGTVNAESPERTF